MPYIPEEDVNAYVQARMSASSQPNSITGQKHDEVNQMLRDSFVHVDRLGGPDSISDGAVESSPLTVGTTPVQFNFDGLGSIAPKANGLHPQHPRAAKGFWDTANARYDLLPDRWYNSLIEFYVVPQSANEVVFNIETRTADGQTVIFNKPSTVRAGVARLASWDIRNRKPDDVNTTIWIYTDSGTVDVQLAALYTTELPSFG